jgi:TonB family protein
MRRFAAILLFLLPMWASGQSAPEPISEKHLYARPLIIVQPKIPTEVAVESYPAEVRVSGIVTRDGRLTAPVFVNAEGKDAFARTVKDVIEHWRFAPALTKECSTRDSAGEVVIWFEIKDGKPTILVSNPLLEKHSTDASLPKRKLRSYEVRPKRPEYPYRAVRAGVEGAAEIAVEVDPQGEIINWNVVYSLPVKDFGEEAIAAMKRARFTNDDSPGLDDKNICIVQPWHFCLLSGVEYPIWACSQRRTQRDGPPKPPARELTTGSRLPQ